MLAQHDDSTWWFNNVDGQFLLPWFAGEILILCVWTTAVLSVLNFAGELLAALTLRGARIWRPTTAYLPNSNQTKPNMFFFPNIQAPHNLTNYSQRPQDATGDRHTGGSEKDITVRTLRCWRWRWIHIKPRQGDVRPQGLEQSPLSFPPISTWRSNK